MNVAGISLSDQISRHVRKFIKKDQWERIPQNKVDGIEGPAYRFEEANSLDVSIVIYVGKKTTAASLRRGVRKYLTYIDTPNGLYEHIEWAIEQRKQNKDRWVQGVIAGYLRELERYPHG